MNCCNSMPSLQFVYGECKYVWFKITSCIEQMFVITSATYELRRSNNEIVASGECELDGVNTLRALLQPPARGVYILCVTYTIPPETKKAEVRILVN